MNTQEKSSKAFAKPTLQPQAPSPIYSEIQPAQVQVASDQPMPVQASILRLPRRSAFVQCLLHNAESILRAMMCNPDYVKTKSEKLR